MSVQKFVFNENNSSKISKGLHPEDVHLARIGKSFALAGVNRDDTVYFHRKDGLQGSGKVLEIGPSGELLVMEKSILPFEEEHERYLAVGEYYRDRASCLTKSQKIEKSEGDKKENVNDASEIRRHMEGIDHELSEIEERPADMNAGGEKSAAYKKWMEKFEETKGANQDEENAEGGKKTPEKTQEMAGEHIERHQEKYGMPHDQAVAVWLSEARKKGLGGIPPKKEEDLNVADNMKVATEDPVKPLGQPMNKAMEVWQLEHKKGKMRKMKKSFKSDAGKKRWEAAVKKGKERAKEGKPHSFNKAHIPHTPADKQIISGDLNEQIGAPTGSKGPVKGTPAYDKWLTSFRSSHPQVYKQSKPVAPKKEGKILGQKPAAKLEEILQKKDAKKNANKQPVKTYEGPAGKYLAAGGEPHKKGSPIKERTAEGMRKSAREQEDKDKSTKDQVLPSQAPSMKELADKKLPPSEMPPRAR